MCIYVSAVGGCATDTRSSGAKQTQVDAAARAKEREADKAARAADAARAGQRAAGTLCCTAIWVPYLQILLLARDCSVTLGMPVLVINRNCIRSQVRCHSPRAQSDA